MSVVVMVVGGLLSILGIAGYIYGLDLMPTERGVAGVISSSVIIVGGVLTLAIGLLLRKLEDFGKALGLNELAALPPPVVAPAAPAERDPLPTLEDAIAMPTVVPVQPVPAPEPARESARDLPPVAIEAPKPKMEAPVTAASKFDLPRPSMKAAATAAGVATAGTLAAKSGLDAVEKALSFDAPVPDSAPSSAPAPVPPREAVVAPLNLPRLSPRGEAAPAPQPAKPTLRAHEVEYPVEVLKALDPEPAPVAAPAVELTPATAVDLPLPDYAEVPMPAPEPSQADDFEAELERLLPLKPADKAKSAPAMPEVTEFRVEKPLTKPEASAETEPKASGIKSAEIKAEENAAQEIKKPEIKNTETKIAETKNPDVKNSEIKPEKRRGPAKMAEAALEKPEIGSETVAVAPPAAPAPTAPAPAAPVPVPAIPTPAPGAEIVGAYESGGAKYTMYSDGSVIAEAEGQTMFFKSLEELREFIDGGTKT